MCIRDSRISEELLKQYDKEMTIVLQNQYWDLKVTESAFEVGLSFNGQPEMLHVPFAAIKSFFDPSVQFALQFDPATVPDEREADEANADAATEAASGEAASEEGSGEKVVSLDAFRKKP